MPSDSLNKSYVISNPKNIHQDVKDAFRPENVLSPAHYAGIVEVTHNDAICAVKDSGGLLKYGGVNHDAVTAVKSNLPDPENIHEEFIKDFSKKLKKDYSKAPRKDTNENDKLSGSTLTLITTKDDRIHTSFLGDSPAWAMEIKTDGTVIPHLLHDSITRNSPVPFAANVIQNMFREKDGDFFSPANIPNQPKAEEIKRHNVFNLSSLEENSTVIILAGSDGLTNHVGLNQQKYERQQGKYLTFKEAKKIIFEPSDTPHDQEKLNKLTTLINEGNIDINDQINKTGEAYANVIQQHLEKNQGEVNYEKLGSEIILKANELSYDAGKPLESKDNTSFILSKVPKNEEKTIIVADGNGPNGNIIAEKLVEFSKNYFSAEKSKSTLLEREGTKTYTLNGASKGLELVSEITQDSGVHGEIAERLNVVAETFGSGPIIRSERFTPVSDQDAKEYLNKDNKFNSKQIAYFLTKENYATEARTRLNELNTKMAYAKDLENLEKFQQKHPGVLREILTKAISDNPENFADIVPPKTDKDALVIAQMQAHKERFAPIFSGNTNNTLASRFSLLEDFPPEIKPMSEQKLISDAAKSFEQSPQKHIRKIGEALVNSGKLTGESTGAVVEAPQHKISDYLNKSKFGRGVKIAAGAGAIVAAGFVAASSGGTAIGLAVAGLAVGVTAGVRAAYKEERMNAEMENREFQWKKAMSGSVRNAKDAVTGEHFLPKKHNTSKDADGKDNKSTKSHSSGFKGFLVSAYKVVANGATLNAATTAVYVQQGRDFDKIRKKLESERAEAEQKQDVQSITKSHPMSVARDKTSEVSKISQKAIHSGVNTVKDKASPYVSYAKKLIQRKSAQNPSTEMAR